MDEEYFAPEDNDYTCTDDLEPEDYADVDNTWYHVKTINQEFYTPFKTSRREYFEVTPGKNPSAEDWATLMNKPENQEIGAWTEAGIAYRSTREVAGDNVIVPGGVYRHQAGQSPQVPERLEIMHLREDAIISLGGAFDEVKEDIEKFIAKKKIYKDLNLIYKMGQLYWGDPGQGKSIFIRKVIKEVVPKDAIVIYVAGRFPSDLFLTKLNENMKDRLKVFIFEELTEMTDNYQQTLLSFLDGEQSVDGSLIIGTTNYPEKLPQNVVNRPSRFDKIYEFESPTADDRQKLITYFMSRPATEEEVKLTNKMSIASLKELCLLVLISDLTLHEAVKKIKDRKALCDKHFAKGFEKGVGFGM